ncbi:cupin domain-containing protein [Hyphococcus flavus]|uniref:Cupin domain-containing protein n=1 Tax=Hyphococcus flavus TaxID=1866326 RepID=A0AAF0CFS2_9PROT|nr:cupin domain-containing protein [Hyphococcus flavus]WDI31679.1 cupin domain-containing protein [Hyphococcus flavus]
MDWKSLRRVITDNSLEGRSRVLIDGEAAKLIAVEEAGLAEIWSADLADGGLRDVSDHLAESDLKLEPEPGAVKVRWFTVAPEDPSKSLEEREAAAAFGFGAIGAAHCRVDASRHPMMHKTESMDVIILIKGEVELLLDDGEVSLKPGDVVIQRATNHAWVNHGQETALLVAVLIHDQQ